MLSDFIYHHSRSLEHSPFGIVTQNKEVDRLDILSYGAFQWLEGHIGFYPLFMAVGSLYEDIIQTGYQNQFRRTFPAPNNKVLFSFRYIPSPCAFIDSRSWDIVLNRQQQGSPLTQWETRLVLKPSWSRYRWLSLMRKEPGSVQVVVPYLNLCEAGCVWVRNKDSRKVLLKRGFSQVFVKRIQVSY